MQVEELPDVDTSELDRVCLDADGISPRVVPAATYDQFPAPVLRTWCHRHAFYVLPTVELVERLRLVIGGRVAIEIAAGNGALGRALGIPATDSKAQIRPDVRALYESIRQPLIEYGPNVLELDALEAVERFKPQVVIGAWVTQRVSNLDPRPVKQGSVYGVRETALIGRVETYVVVGNRMVHGAKDALEVPHQVVSAPWLRSRAMQPALDCIYLWGKVPPVPYDAPLAAELLAFMGHGRLFEASAATDAVLAYARRAAIDPRVALEALQRAAKSEARSA